MPYTISQINKTEARIINDNGGIASYCYRGSHHIWRLFVGTDPVTQLPGEYASAAQAFNAFLDYINNNRTTSLTGPIKDKRYLMVKRLIKANELHGFREIFDIVPRSIFARDMGLNNMRAAKLINQVEDFVLRDLFRFADFLEVDKMQIIHMVYAQYVADQMTKA